MDEKVFRPEPDLATKPKDIIGYCFGFSCPKHHIGITFDSITIDRYGEQRTCQTCGEIATPAIIKRTAEAQWIDLHLSNVMECVRIGAEYKPVWGWNQYYGVSLNKIWTKYEFVRFLNDVNPNEAIKPGGETNV
jgi:hypothetical protein